MPCKINVLEENGKVKIIRMELTMISKLFPEINKQEVEEIEKEIREIIDKVR